MFRSTGSRSPPRVTGFLSWWAPGLGASLPSQEVAERVRAARGCGRAGRGRRRAGRGCGRAGRGLTRAAQGPTRAAPGLTRAGRGHTRAARGRGRPAVRGETEGGDRPKRRAPRGRGFTASGPRSAVWAHPATGTLPSTHGQRCSLLVLNVHARNFVYYGQRQWESAR